jgi:hypothetical protein
MKLYGKAAAWVRAHPGLTATIGAAAVAAGTYYGVPPQYSQPVLAAICDGLALCPQVAP